MSGEPAGDVPWHRQRSKVLAVGLIILLCVIAIGFAVGLWLTMSGLKNSEPYRITVERVQSDRQVVDLLGTPLEPGWMVLGEVNEASGQSNLAFSIEGPNGKAGVRASLEIVDAEWTITRLDLGIGNRETGRAIVLVAPPAETATQPSP